MINLLIKYLKTFKIDAYSKHFSATTTGFRLTSLFIQHAKPPPALLVCYPFFNYNVNNNIYENIFIIIYRSARNIRESRISKLVFPRFPHNQKCKYFGILYLYQDLYNKV